MADNQNNYQNNQIYQIDIDKIYSDFIQEIDSIRSYINTTNPNNTSNLLKSLQSNDKNIASNIKPETTLQESRCHAFFRLIGFPVVGSNYKIYNPGHDIIYDENKTIKFKNKVEIALDPLPKFNKLSFERETVYLKNLDVFSKQLSIDSGVLALSSGSSGLKSINLRAFNSVFKNDDAFDMDTKNQSYTFDLLSIVGKNEISLFNYQGPDGSFANLNKSKKHIVKPFIVDPLIDFSVSPSTNRVNVPFAPDQLYTKISFDKFAKRPLIEKIIRDRFSVNTEIKDAGTSSEALVNYVKSIPAIKDENIINRISSNANVYKISEQVQFVNFINIIREMMKKLVDSLRIIHRAQNLYYWVPKPSKLGPEGGCDIRNTFVPTLIDQNLVTDKDKDILTKVIQANLNQFNIQTSKLDGSPDVGGFAFNNFFGNALNSETSSALGDATQNSLDSLILTRKRVLQKANEALRTVEIIMGEFSGLGLCDIIAMLGALYIMPKNDLTGFLDDDAYARLIKLPEYKNVTHADYQACMKSYASNVKDFYNLMDKIYQDLIRNNGLLT